MIEPNERAALQAAVLDLVREGAFAALKSSRELARAMETAQDVGVSDADICAVLTNVQQRMALPANLAVTMTLAPAATQTH